MRIKQQASALKTNPPNINKWNLSIYC